MKEIIVYKIFSIVETGTLERSFPETSRGFLSRKQGHFQAGHNNVITWFQK